MGTRDSNVAWNDVMTLRCASESKEVSALTWGSVAYFKMLWLDGHREVELPEDMRIFYEFLVSPQSDRGIPDRRRAYDQALLCRRVAIDMGVLPDSHLHGRMASLLARACEEYAHHPESQEMVELAFGPLPVTDAFHSMLFRPPRMTRFLLHTLLPFEGETIDVRNTAQLRRLRTDPDHEGHDIINKELDRLYNP